MKKIIRRILKEENNRIIDRVVEHFIKTRCNIKRYRIGPDKVFIDIDRMKDTYYEFNVGYINSELHDFINHKDIKGRELLNSTELYHSGEYPNYHNNMLKTLRSYGLTDDEVIETYIQILSKLKDKLLMYGYE
jgi:hypothetical protein